MRSDVVANWIAVVRLFERHKRGIRRLILVNSCCDKVNFELVSFSDPLEEDVDDA